MEARHGSIMERLSHVHDPRRREGRLYRLPGLVGMLLLAAVNGEEGLRGMWQWGCGAWQRIAEPLDLWGTPGPPAYGTVWGLLARIDPEELSQALCGGKVEQEEGAYTVDGKVLRGSRRGVAAALQVVTAAGHRCRTVLGQQTVTAGDQVEAALALLQGLPLAGKLVSMDAGLLNRATVSVIEEKGGPTSGL
jgi:hypothetical protein